MFISGFDGENDTSLPVDAGVALYATPAEMVSSSSESPRGLRARPRFAFSFRFEHVGFAAGISAVPPGGNSR